MDIDFQGIEGLFSHLTSSLRESFGASEIQEVQDFIDAGEYGLALETLVDVIDEENKKISSETLAQIQKLASEMSMNREAMLGKLEGHIE